MAKKVLTIVLLLECLVWIAFAIVYGVYHGLNEIQNTLMVLLMLLNGGVFLAFYFNLKKEHKLMKLMLLLFLLLNTVLTITDQMGAFDYIVLCLNGIALISHIGLWYPPKTNHVS